MKIDEKKITMVATCKITSSEGTEIIRTFDKAWVRALELPRPVNCSFAGFVRKA